MSAVCFYFQLHQPRRLTRYNVFNTSTDYFEDGLNQQVMRRVADRCYIAATRCLIDAAAEVDLKLGMSMSVSAATQMQRHAPEALETLQQLTETAYVEWLAETSHHSLACIYNAEEFAEQIALHEQMIDATFCQQPRVFRNSELIHSDPIAQAVGKLGFDTILAEGVDRLLGVESPNAARHTGETSLILRNWRLSDAIAFRFSDPSWEAAPLTPEKFAGWCKQAEGDCVNVFVDYETFGEHQSAETGILDFLRALPKALTDAGVEMVTPSEAAALTKDKRPMSVPTPTSWADAERDVTAWLGNAMQSNAAHEHDKLLAPAKAAGGSVLDTWRDLSSTDHLYYMATKQGTDAAVHRHFSPYDSPYDAYINFMNVLDNLRTQLGVVG
ncbi:MAG: glycoside hydrolase family 57 protein [Planctomycetota bacterium]